jgi:hypothetical protein
MCATARCSALETPERLRFLAVPEDVWNTLFHEPIGETALDRVLCFDPADERITRWISPPSGAT